MFYLRFEHLGKLIEQMLIRYLTSSEHIGSGNSKHGIATRSVGNVPELLERRTLAYIITTTIRVTIIIVVIVVVHRRLLPTTAVRFAVTTATITITTTIVHRLMIGH
jgi:hypothetical protein